MLPSIINHYLPQGILLGLNVQPPFWKFPFVPSVLDMVLNILASHHILTRNLLDLFFRYQVFYQTTIRIYVIVLETRHVVFLSDVEIAFL